MTKQLCGINTHSCIGYVALKHSGIDSITMSLVGHIGTQPNLKKIKFAHVMMYLETEDLDKLKSQAVCFSGEPNLNHYKKKKKNGQHQQV